MLLDKKQAGKQGRQAWQIISKRLAERTSKRTNERTNQQKKRKKLISYCSMCLVRDVFCVLLLLFFVSFLLLFLLEFDSSYFLLYASSRVFCHAIYLICSLMFLRRVHIF